MRTKFVLLIAFNNNLVVSLIAFNNNLNVSLAHHLYVLYVKPFTFYQTQPGQKLEHCFSTKICWRAIFLWVLSHEATTKLCWRAIFLWVLSHEATTKNSLNIWHLVILYNNWYKVLSPAPYSCTSRRKCVL